MSEQTMERTDPMPTTSRHYTGCFGRAGLIAGWNVLIIGDTIRYGLDAEMVNGVGYRHEVPNYGTSISELVARPGFRLGWVRMEDDAEILYFYDRDDDGFGYALNVTCPGFSEWGMPHSRETKPPNTMRAGRSNDCPATLAGETTMLSDGTRHLIAKSLAHVLHAEERAEYIRAAVERGDLFGAAEDCQRLCDELLDAKAHLTALDRDANPDNQEPATCERCGKAIKLGPYCRQCQRDFADHVLESEWTWTGPR